MQLRARQPRTAHEHTASFQELVTPTTHSQLEGALAAMKTRLRLLIAAAATAAGLAAVLAPVSASAATGCYATFAPATSSHSGDLSVYGPYPNWYVGMGVNATFDRPGHHQVIQGAIDSNDQWEYSVTSTGWALANVSVVVDNQHCPVRAQ